MARKPTNSGKAWTPQAKAQLKQLAGGNTPTRVMGIKLGRTPAAVSTEAARQRVSLKPTNQRPYGTRRK
jgi:hypothetical protein